MEPEADEGDDATARPLAIIMPLLYETRLMERIDVDAAIDMDDKDFLARLLDDVDRIGVTRMELQGCMQEAERQGRIPPEGRDALNRIRCV